MNIKYKTIDQTAIDDFSSEVKRRGHNPESYTLIESEVCYIDIGNGLFIWKGKITVKRGSIERTYTTGVGSTWPGGKFIDDLNSGIFD